MLRIHLFGHLRATLGEEPLRFSAAAAALPLWAYLLLHRREPLPRTHVAFTLWPDSSEAEALAHLRRQVHLLARMLPPEPEGRPWIDTDRATVQWNPVGDYWLDVEEFEGLCAGVEAPTAEGSRGRGTRAEITDLERAVALYAGELLADFYDDWVLAARERFSQGCARALTRLLGLQAAHGDLRAAVTTAKRLLAHDRLREESHRLVIGLHYVAGDRAAALNAFNDCRRVLADALDVEPMPETLRLAETIRAAAPAERVLRQLQDDLPQAMDLAAVVPGHVPHNLPSPLTSLIGRERQLEEVTRLLDTERLVTLTGPPGCGKSRLGLGVAAELLARTEGVLDSADAKSTGPERREARTAGPTFPDGLWWVDLAALENPALVPAVVAAALGIGEEPGRTLTELLESEVRPRALLLVLDNVEHMLPECAVLAARLLSAGAGVRVLATSRERLGVPGERVWSVPPLSVPAPEAGTTAERVLRYDGPVLLLDRARRSVPGFDVTDDNAAAVAAVCRRLDGNPLAIELAASRLRDLPVARIAERLEDRFRLLDRSGRTAEPHHQTLGAAIDWSHEHMPVPERTLFRRLGVFRGGWTLEAAEAVCAGNGFPESEILDLLAGLVDKSLVAVRALAGTRRYQMPKSIRQYARDRLADSGETEALRGRHLAHFLALAEEAEQYLTSDDKLVWLNRLELERGNLQAALEWAAEGASDPEPAERLAVALWAQSPAACSLPPTGRDGPPRLTIGRWPDGGRTVNG